MKPVRVTVGRNTDQTRNWLGWTALFVVILASLAWMVWMGLQIYLGIQLGMDLAEGAKTEIVKSSLSPNERWEVRILYIDEGATGAGYRAEVVDLKGAAKPRTINSSPYYLGENVKWKNSNTVVLDGHEINVGQKQGWLSPLVLGVLAVSGVIGVLVHRYAKEPAESNRLN